MKCIKKLVAVALAAVLALAMLTACDGSSNVPNATEQAEQIVNNINAVRTKNGLPALKTIPAATDVANKIAALREKKELSLISEEDYKKKSGELRSIQVNGRSYDGYLVVISPISGEKDLTEKSWQKTYDRNNRYSDCRIVRSADAKYVGVVMKQISNGEYITVVITY